MSEGARKPYAVVVSSGLWNQQITEILRPAFSEDDVLVFLDESVRVEIEGGINPRAREAINAIVERNHSPDVIIGCPFLMRQILSRINGKVTGTPKRKALLLTSHRSSYGNIIGVFKDVEEKDILTSDMLTEREGATLEKIISMIEAAGISRKEQTRGSDFSSRTQDRADESLYRV